MDIGKIEIRTQSDLAKLPWFKLGEDGKLRIDPAAGVTEIIDDHSHLGWSYFFGGVIDHMDASRPVKYFYDYDMDQDVLNEKTHPTPEEGKLIEKDIYMMLFRCPPIARTQTAPHMIEEMDRFNVKHILVSPIEIPFRSRHARQTFATAAKCGGRLIPFAAVHPYTPSYEKRVRTMIAQGARGFKYHPEFQFVAPDNKKALRLFALLEELDLPVLCHTGFTGAEPAFMQKLAALPRYRVIFESFPKLKFVLGHAGLKNIPEALAYAAEFPQVYLDLAGQTAECTREIIQKADVDRVLYGSDWPFYPMGVTLGRTLVATEGMPEEVRRKVLHDNAAKLYKLDQC
ncbi:MAG: amidohydrolase family protein [bacterium]